MKRFWKSPILFLIILIFIDQISKYIIRTRGGFYICNKDLAWGIPMPYHLFWIVWVVVLALIIWQLLLHRKRILLWPGMAIVAGSIGNAIDRYLLGCVFDFIALPYWPVFNLADIYITIGAIILIYLQMRKAE
jgi:signal peptidase II